MLSESELLSLCNKCTAKGVEDILLPLLEKECSAAAFLVVLEGVVAAVLMAVKNNDRREAAAVLEEALVPGVIQRIARAKSSRRYSVD